jgi:hypothetical protein
LGTLEGNTFVDSENREEKSGTQRTKVKTSKSNVLNSHFSTTSQQPSDNLYQYEYQTHKGRKSEKVEMVMQTRQTV